MSNVEDFSNWIASVRGDTKLVISEHRPVPLEQHVIVQADEHTEPEVLDLYRRDGNGEQTTKLNAELINRLDQLDRKAHAGAARNAPDCRAFCCIQGMQSIRRKKGKRYWRQYVSD
mgnify:CR=1 FL=1